MPSARMPRRSRGGIHALFLNLAGHLHLAVPLLEFPHASRTNIVRIKVAQFGRGIHVRYVNGGAAATQMRGHRLNR